MNIKFFTGLCLIVLIVMSGCSKSPGIVRGNLSSKETQEPLASVQVILCLVSNKNKSLCTLQASPTTRTDASGYFELAGIPPGEYLLMYGFPGEIKSTPGEWGGIEVGPLTMGLTREGNLGSTGKGEFWEDGYESDGEMWTSGALSVLNNGYVRSNRFGISIMVEETKRMPYVIVQPDGTFEIEWILCAR